MSVGSRQTSQAAREVQDVLQERDIPGLGVVAVSTAGGVVVAQEVADRVLPALGFRREPTNATGFAASAGTKGTVALAMGVLAARLSGVPLLIAAWGGVGALAGAGADLFNAIQRTGFFAEAPGNFSGAQSHSHQSHSGGGASTNSVSPSTNGNGASASAEPDAIVA